MLYLVAMWSSGWEMQGLGSKGEDLFNNIYCSSVCAVAVFQSAGIRKQSGSCKSNLQRGNIFLPLSTEQTATCMGCQSGAFPQHYVCKQHTEWITDTQTAGNITRFMLIAQCLLYWCAQFMKQMMLLLLCAHQFYGSSR